MKLVRRLSWVFCLFSSAMALAIRNGTASYNSTIGLLYSPNSGCTGVVLCYGQNTTVVLTAMHCAPSITSFSTDNPVTSNTVPLHPTELPPPAVTTVRVPIKNYLVGGNQEGFLLVSYMGTVNGTPFSLADSLAGGMNPWPNWGYGLTANNSNFFTFPITSPIGQYDGNLLFQQNITKDPDVGNDISQWLPFPNNAGGTIGCSGDSGGPLTDSSDTAIYGIGSNYTYTGQDTCSNTTSNYYMNISPYRASIVNAANTLLAGCTE